MVSSLVPVWRGWVRSKASRVSGGIRLSSRRPPTYAVGMDELDFGAQPHCPEDDVVMRDIPGGWKCPYCGHLQMIGEVEMPPEFDGPSIHGG